MKQHWLGVDSSRSVTAGGLAMFLPVVQRKRLCGYPGMFLLFLGIADFIGLQLDNGSTVDVTTETS